MSPRPVKTVERAVFLVRHWKLLLIVALVLAPLVGASYYGCSQRPEGCSTFSVVVGVFRILAKPFT